jgi:hypothetical protein
MVCAPHGRSFAVDRPALTLHRMWRSRDRATETHTGAAFTSLSAHPAGLDEDGPTRRRLETVPRIGYEHALDERSAG